MRYLIGTSACFLTAMPSITILQALRLIITFPTCICSCLLLGTNFSPHHSTTINCGISLLIEEYKSKLNFALAPAQPVL